MWFLGLILAIVVIILLIRKKKPATPPKIKLPDETKPTGKLIYSDTDGNAKPLADFGWGVAGKPDEVWIIDGKLHIIEFKSSTLPPHMDQPFIGHKAQLATYMRLAEVNFKLPVAGGEIYYADGRSFHFEWSPDMKNLLLETIRKMRKVEETGKTYIRVNERKCRSCYFNSVCEKV